MRRARALACLLLLAADGCGYALVGRGTVVDPSIKRIGVPLFKDNTGKPAIDQQLIESFLDGHDCYKAAINSRDGGSSRPRHPARKSAKSRAMYSNS